MGASTAQYVDDVRTTHQRTLVLNDTAPHITLGGEEYVVRWMCFGWAEGSTPRYAEVHASRVSTVTATRVSTSTVTVHYRLSASGRPGYLTAPDWIAALASTD